MTEQEKLLQLKKEYQSITEALSSLNDFLEYAPIELPNVSNILNKVCENEFLIEKEYDTLYEKLYPTPPLRERNPLEVREDILSTNTSLVHKLGTVVEQMHKFIAKSETINISEQYRAVYKELINLLSSKQQYAEQLRQEYTTQF